MGRAGWGDRALSFVMLAGLTPMSGTPYDISPTGLFVHVDSLGSFTWWLGYPEVIVEATGLVNVCFQLFQNVTVSVSCCTKPVVRPAWFQWDGDVDLSGSSANRSITGPQALSFSNSPILNMLPFFP